MSAKDIARAIVTSEPCRSVLVRIGKIPLGLRVLKGISQPCAVFQSLDEAWSAAKRANPVGHEDSREIEVHLEYSKSLRPSDYPVLYSLSQIRLGQETLRIFDFGGNVGNLYLSYSSLLKQRGKIEWTVYDIPSVVQEGMGRFAGTDRPDLRFTNSVSDITRKHVLLVSGAFHYWEKSVLLFLDQLPELPDHVIINRRPVGEMGPSFITVQRTQTCAFPCIVRSADEIISGFSSRGYMLIDRWKALELSLTLPLFPDRSIPYYSGFYFRRPV